MAFSSIKQKKSGTRFEVYSGVAYQTRGGLTKNDLKKVNGVVYSKKELEKKREKIEKTKEKLKEKSEMQKWKLQQFQMVQNPIRPTKKKRKAPKTKSWADMMGY